MQNLGYLGWATSPKLRFLALNSCRAHLFLRSRLAFESHVPKYKFQLCTFQYCNFNIAPFNTAISISHFQYCNFNTAISIPHLYLPSPFLGNVDLLPSPFLGGLVFTNSTLYLALWCCFMCFIAFITNMLNTTKYKGYITLNEDIFGQIGLRFLKSIFKAKWPPYN